MDIEKMIHRIQTLKLSCSLETPLGVRHFHHGCEYVEIGGIKWATMNVGAKKVTDYGLYFQWADTQGYTAAQVGVDKTFNWENYKYGDGGNFSKYNYNDGLTTIEASDDAAHTILGGRWRMPTDTEWQILIDTTNIDTTNRSITKDYKGSGIRGIILIDKNDSSKELFFPAAGYCGFGSVYNVGSYGLYWSSSLSTSNVTLGRRLSFSSGDCYMSSNYRCFGYAVRGVVG